MGINDSAAQKAIQMGHSASEFEAAAQKHANATWVFLVVAALVWYLASWMWALIPFGFAVITGVKSASSTLLAERIKKIGG